ncbi:tRNA pseudouridine(65) synthase TruC [Aestuariibacter sp. AA17]|uniref:tRNA pseudouridine synthase C n=1 Tax=Fluctibacter corallii TaxID=2984329 RepID=A0ABT3A8R2_9ALTE|nr:tRNA pseudouridine(65) synthase TruC [Aestuariibacter sp. AA17]MCV2884979.1 tRNA pseudouridine(65) synthase TruC [Aestuariibacter sp. AA17]
MNLPIIYQDEHIVAVHKPSGLLVHRSLIDKRETEFAMQMVRDQIGQHVYTVHRLDRPTSGVLLFGLSSEVARRLTEQFTQKHIEKTYYAIVRGYAPEQGDIDYALKEKLDKIADKMANKDKEAQDARTLFKRLGTFELPFAVGRYQTARYSLVRLNPLTGRKHQLRRHMAHIRHPIVGDTTHGDGKQNKFVRDEFGFNGLALTCQAMHISHPISGEPLALKTAFDDRMEGLLTRWGWDHCDIRKITESLE